MKKTPGEQLQECTGTTYRGRSKQIKAVSSSSRRMSWMGMLLALVLGLAGCGASSTSGPSASALPEASQEPAVTTASATTSEATPEATPDATPVPEAAVAGEPLPVPTQDRAGTPITVPAEVKRIVSLAPSFTEILIDMGLSERIVAIDMNAVTLTGVDAAWPVFDMMAPDTEKLLALEADILLASPISTGGGEDPFKLLRDAGVCVIYVPTSNSIAAIQEDVLFVGAVVGESGKARQMVADMQAGIDEVAAISATVTEKKRVHFEISAAPYIYSFGKGVFLDEMLTLIGAENVYADQDSWIPVADEVALASDPDVILTNVSYLPDAVGEIKERAGWSELEAVKGGQVFSIDNMSSSLPNHNIVKALRQMAEAVYPDLY